MSRTVRIKKSKELKDKDFYQTHPAMVRALIAQCFAKDISVMEVFDPCCGKKVIGNVFRDHMVNIYESDLYPNDNTITKANFLKSNSEFEVVVMNPPYSDKYNFIDHAITISDRSYVLLPLDTSNYNVFHKNYLNQPTYLGRLLMTPKVILHEDLKTKRGGNSSYAWYEFSDKFKRDPSQDAYERYANLMDFGL